MGPIRVTTPASITNNVLVIFVISMQLSEQGLDSGAQHCVLGRAQCGRVLLGSQPALGDLATVDCLGLHGMQWR